MTDTRPTTIYWLCDTSVPGWPKGEPFYCGKSVDPAQRLRLHRSLARRGKRCPVSVRVAACPPEALQMNTMEVVPHDGDWIARERQWIKHIRHLNPTGCVNVEDAAMKERGPVRYRRSETFEEYVRGITPRKVRDLSPELYAIYWEGWLAHEAFNRFMNERFAIID